jgi:general secretion pathway protein D
MDFAKRPSFLHGRAALLACAGLVAPLVAEEPPGLSELAQRELARRNAGVEEARELLRKGDEAYEAQRYDQAMVAFSGARDLLPDAPLTGPLRDAATERYVQATIEQSRFLSRKGDVPGAKALMDQVLSPGVAPDHHGAVTFRNQLDDPIRTNPALDAEHAANVDRVRRLLYTAEGAYQLGKFDESKTRYQEVLQIDPFNQAARRGMERVAAEKSRYAGAAYDHTRAEMLEKVDKEWELSLSSGQVDVPMGPDTGVAVDADFIPVSRKLDRIIFPSINLDQASIEEAIELLRVRSVEFDQTELDPSRKGVNFNLDIGGKDSERGNEIRNLRFDLRLTNVPLSTILKYLGEMTKTTISTDDFAVVIRPMGADNSTLVSRNYRVPPDFLDSLGNGNAGAGNDAAADPFAEPAAGGGGLLAVRRGAEEVLRDQGMSFPDGAGATFNPATSTLRFTNTEANHDVIRQMIEAVAQTEPVMVAVSVTMIKVQERRLEELGFDWLLDQFGFAGDSWIPGADVLNLTGGTTGNGGDLGDVPLPLGALERRPITAGNRSGEGAISTDSIDALLAIGGSGSRPSQARAPGALWFNGALNNGGVQMLMRALDQQKGVDLMANPSTVTRSGQEASVNIIREFIYPSEYDPPELPNSVGDVEGLGGAPSFSPVTPANPTAFVKRDVGIVLNVLPTADEKRQFIDITLNPIITEFDGFINLGSPILAQAPLGIGQIFGQTAVVELTANAIRMPIFSVQKVQTSVTIADNATMVIGGLLEDKIQNVEDKTPILGDIPGVGRLFQSKAQQNISTAVVFLVHVRLLDPTGRPYSDR